MTRRTVFKILAAPLAALAAPVAVLARRKSAFARAERLNQAVALSAARQRDKIQVIRAVKITLRVPWAPGDYIETLCNRDAPEFAWFFDQVNFDLIAAGVRGSVGHLSMQGLGEKPPEIVVYDEHTVLRLLSTLFWKSAELGCPDWRKVPRAVVYPRWESENGRPRLVLLPAHWRGKHFWRGKRWEVAL